MFVVAAVLALSWFGAGPRGAEPQDDQHGHSRHDATTNHPFNGAERWSRVFDAPDRDAWQKPAEVTAALAISPGMIVADLGAGTGYFLPHLSRAVGIRGIVLAIDTEADMVAHLGARMREAGTDNVVPVLALADEPFLPGGRVDRVLIVDTYHHINDRLGYFGRLKRALATNGQVAIIDFMKKPLPVGPPPDHKLERAFVIEEMRLAGWRLVDQPEMLPYQYFLIFEPAEPAEPGEG